MNEATKKERKREKPTKNLANMRFRMCVNIENRCFSVGPKLSVWLVAQIPQNVRATTIIQRNIFKRFSNDWLSGL